MVAAVVSLLQAADEPPGEAGVALLGGCRLHRAGDGVPHWRNLSFLETRDLIGAEILHFLPKVKLGDAVSMFNTLTHEFNY